MTAALRDDVDEVAAFRARFLALKRAIGDVVVGRDDTITGVLCGLIAGGHVLLEGPPGTGKTLLCKTVARAAGLGFARIQFTPDLLPADILGGPVLRRGPSGEELVFQPGPIFAQLVLADELNRASPRTQAALLEVMEERQVTTPEGTRALDEPFVVLATQNPHDQGTYPLPESQLDRFLLRIRIGYPPPQVEMRLLTEGSTDRAADVKPVLDPGRLVELQRAVQRVALDASLASYLQAVVQATRSAPALSLGASTRGAIALASAARARALVRGRSYCIADDIHDLAVPALAHRVRLSSAADGFLPTREEAEAAVRELVARVPVPL